MSTRQENSYADTSNAKPEQGGSRSEEALSIFHIASIYFILLSRIECFLNKYTFLVNNQKKKIIKEHIHLIYKNRQIIKYKYLQRYKIIDIIFFVKYKKTNKYLEFFAKFY